MVAVTSSIVPDRHDLKLQLTTMVPFIPGCTVHVYWYVPAVVNFTSQVAPGSSDRSLMSEWLSNVTVCDVVPGTVHWMMSPTWAFCEAGENASWSVATIVTVAVPRLTPAVPTLGPLLLVAGPSLPQATIAATRTAMHPVVKDR